MAEATQALVKQERDPSGDIMPLGFGTVAGFAGLQRVARAFAASTLVPDTYRGNDANCIIAVEMAARMGASPLMVMQNLYLVHGRPGWSSQFLISAFNGCGRFSAIKYKWTGQKNTPSWGCIAYATELKSGEVVEGPEVTIAMAKAEGWSTKAGSKWINLPQLMLTYRAATFLVRTTAPELTMGLLAADEVEDIARDVTPRKRGTVAAVSMPEPANDAPPPAEEPTDAEIVPDEVALVDRLMVRITEASTQEHLVSAAKAIADAVAAKQINEGEKAVLDAAYAGKRKQVLTGAAA